jgi:hypothetical protein
LRRSIVKPHTVNARYFSPGGREFAQGVEDSIQKALRRGNGLGAEAIVMCVEDTEEKRYYIRKLSGRWGRYTELTFSKWVEEVRTPLPV